MFTVQMYPVAISFLGLLLRLSIVEAFTIGSAVSITQQLEASLHNVSLETIAEGQYNSQGFTLSLPESIKLTSGSISTENSTAPLLNTTLGTYVKCAGAGRKTSPAPYFSVQADREYRDNISVLPCSPRNNKTDLEKYNNSRFRTQPCKLLRHAQQSHTRDAR